MSEGRVRGVKCLFEGGRIVRAVGVDHSGSEDGRKSFVEVGNVIITECSKVAEHSTKVDIAG